MAERTKTGTATNTLSNEVTRDSSQTNVQTLPPPPPPPPPPPQQAYHGRVCCIIKYIIDQSHM